MGTAGCCLGVFYVTGPLDHQSSQSYLPFFRKRPAGKVMVKCSLYFQLQAPQMETSYLFSDLNSQPETQRQYHPRGGRDIQGRCAHGATGEVCLICSFSAQTAFSASAGTTSSPKADTHYKNAIFLAVFWKNHIYAPHFLRVHLHWAEVRPIISQAACWGLAWVLQI